MRNRKTVLLIITLLLSCMLIIGFTAYKKSGDNDSDNDAVEATSEEMLEDDAVDDDPARDSDESFDQLLVDTASSVQNKKAQELNSDAKNFYGTWSALSDRAKYFYGNIDMTIKKDGTFSANVTDENFSGTWTKTDYGIHFDNEYLWGVMYYGEKCKMIFDDDDLKIVLTKMD